MIEPIIKADSPAGTWYIFNYHIMQLLVNFNAPFRSFEKNMCWFAERHVRSVRRGADNETSTSDFQNASETGQMHFLSYILTRRNIWKRNESESRSAVITLSPLTIQCIVIGICILQSLQITKLSGKKACDGLLNNITVRNCSRSLPLGCVLIVF